MTRDFDCIVIGGGHAGIEAAHAAAKMGARTALITLGRDTIAKMSCNPAIGGLAKGQIAREVDALGGLMGLAIDATGIQFRMLNRSKGPAVQSPRAQADKHKYSVWMRETLERTDNLTIIEAAATEILVEDRTVRAVACQDGSVYRARTVVVATGTFLGGLIHIGAEQASGGRLGEPASTHLSESLTRLGFRLERLKTGTPARLDALTVDFDKCEVQHGDSKPVLKVTEVAGTQASTVHFFDPEDDAFLEKGNPSNSEQLRVEDNKRVTYMKFNVSGLSGDVQSATLELTENGDTGNGTLRFHKGS